MFGLFSSKPKRVQSTVAYTVKSTIQVHNRQMDQVQYITENYVVNDIGGKLIVYRADTNERYTANRGTRELRRLDFSAQIAQARQLQSIMGNVPVVVDPEEVEVSGYPCQRATFRVEVPQMVIDSETFRTRIPGLERTAFAAERALDEVTQPVRTGASPDQVVVQSTVQVLAAGTSQNQSTRLVSVSEGIDNLAEMDEILTYKIVD
jgi:hypothetical protein